MPLGTEVDLGPGHMVLGGDPAPHRERGTSSPSFRPTPKISVKLKRGHPQRRRQMQVR